MVNNNKYSNITNIKQYLRDLNNPAEEVRVDAVFDLLEVQDPVVVEPLIEHLNDPSEWVRRKVAWGLGEIADDRAEEPLKKALNDLDDNVVEAAKRALKKLESKSNPTDFSKNIQTYLDKQDKTDQFISKHKKLPKNKPVKNHLQEYHRSELSGKRISNLGELPAIVQRKIKNITFLHYFLGFYETKESKKYQRNDISKQISKYKFYTGNVCTNTAKNFARDIIYFVNDQNLKFDVMIPIPSSDANTISLGHRTLVSIVSDQLSIENGTGILTRTISVKKSHNSGTRPIKEHENSIKCGSKIFDKKILLYDDIYTHGNTADACILLLKNNGANDISLFTLGRTNTSKI